MTYLIIIAVVTAFIFYLCAIRPFMAFFVMGAAALGGMLLFQDLILWITTPFKLWILYVPAGIFCGAATYIISGLLVRNLAKIFNKPVKYKSGKADGLTSDKLNHESAEQSAGSVIGTDRYGRIIGLSDKQANQHTLVLGTTGAGKTVTVCNIVESAIDRSLPLIYIDGKGDYDLAQRVARYGIERGKPISIFAMNGESQSYNPLATGGFTSKKDRIIELREWSEEHYKKLAEGYLQTVFKIMDACGIPCNMATLAEHFDWKYLMALIRKHEKNIPNAQELMAELGAQNKASESIESLVAEIRNFTASEIGALFCEKEGEEFLTLSNVIAQNGVAYFCLPALEFPSMSQTLGRLIINDLKATMAQQLSGGVKKKVYVVFDEFSVFAGKQVLNLINMGRGAGIHAVLSTQSLADIAPNHADNLVRQVIGNCNNFILHRQNAPEDAALLAELIGTRNTLEYTAQIDTTGPTTMGTVRRTRGFIAHPDEIKALGTGEAFFFTKEGNKISKIKVRKGKI